MRTELLALVAALAVTSAQAAGGGGHVQQHANNDVSNKASLQTRRAQLRELLPRLSLGEVRALQPAGRRHRDHRAAADRQPDVHRRAAARHDRERDQRRRCQPRVRRRAAGSVAGGAQPRPGLHLQLPAVLLRGSRQGDRRQQPGTAGHRDAARALGAAGHPERGLGRPGRRAGQRLEALQGIRARLARPDGSRTSSTHSCATPSTSSTTSPNPCS